MRTAKIFDIPLIDGLSQHKIQVQLLIVQCTISVQRVFSFTSCQRQFDPLREKDAEDVPFGSGTFPKFLHLRHKRRQVGRLIHFQI